MNTTDSCIFWWLALGTNGMNSIDLISSAFLFHRSNKNSRYFDGITCVEYYIEDHIATDDELAAMQHVASKVLEGISRPSRIEMRNLVKELKDIFDIDSSGTIDRREAMQAVGRVSKRKMSLLT
jgi:hypothetical protein